MINPSNTLILIMQTTSEKPLGMTKKRIKNRERSTNHSQELPTSKLDLKITSELRLFSLLEYFLFLLLGYLPTT